MVTPVTVGTLLSMVTSAYEGVPASSPSFGVTVQRTIWPPMKEPLIVFVVPAATEFTVHSIVD